MKREIKYKFWLGHIKKMTYEHSLSDISHAAWDFTEDIVPIQFTGLPFNICEGDIIKPKNNTSIFVVLWNDHHCCFSAFGKYDYEQIVSGDALLKLNTICNKGNIRREWILEHEISPIGNIYENPELLNK